jgi:hypothetical protein
VSHQLLDSDGEHFTGERFQEFLDVRSQRWVLFGRVWNEVICKLRDNDHLSDKEKEILLFSTFDWFSKPIYLPLFQTAGCTETAIYKLKEAAASYHEEKESHRKLLVYDVYMNQMDVTTKEAVAELWELLGWVFEKLLGSIHRVGYLLRYIYMHTYMYIYIYIYMHTYVNDTSTTYLNDNHHNGG